MKNVLKNILFSICFTYLSENRRSSPFIYSCARRRLWTVTGALKMEGREKSRGLSLGKRRKRGKERRHGWGGMKGNGENVGEDKRKEERNDGRKVCTLTESTPVLT